MKPVQSCDVFSHHHHDKLEVWPSASTQFAMQGLNIAIQQQQQQCTWGYTRGGVWLLESQNITNPRRTFWHGPSLAPFAHERDEFSPKYRCTARVCVASYRGSGCVRVRDWGNAALWQIVRYMRLDISAVISRQFARIRRKVLGFSRWQLERPAPSLEASEQVSVSL